MNAPSLTRGDLSVLEKSIERLEHLGVRPAIQFVDCGFVRRQVARLTDGIEASDVRINTYWMSREVGSIRSLRLLRSYLYDGAYAPEHPKYAEQRTEQIGRAHVCTPVTNAPL